MKFVFHGAARSVTGSMHLIEANGKKLLLDCGLFQGRREESNRINRKLPFNAREIDAVILSHAHIDHSGNLPNLVKNGFRGKIHATSASVDLASLMLRDSARIQEGDANYFNRKFPKQKIEPNYTSEDAEEAIQKFSPISYGKWFEPLPSFQARFLDAGHIIGAGIVEIEVQENGKTIRIVFTGDLGRRGLPILRDPESLPECDFVISESTYGDRGHPKLPDMEGELAKILRDCATSCGRLIIPAFSVGRTQNLVYAFSRIMRDGRAPTIPIFVDSPLSTEATKVVARHPEVYDQEMRETIAEQGSPLFFRGVRYVESVEESKSLNRMKNPIIIISASGMCESGRVLHHLIHAIGNSCNTVLLVGFQAVHTLGRRLREGQKRVRILGEEFDVRAKILNLDGFSAHADRNDLLAALSPLANKATAAFLVHGEEDAALSLKEGLLEKGFRRVEIPARGEEFVF